MHLLYLFEIDALARRVGPSDDLDSALGLGALEGVGHEHWRAQLQQGVSATQTSGSNSCTQAEAYLLSSPSLKGCITVN